MKFFVHLFFEYFDRIFMKFSTKCRTKNLGMYTPFLEVLLIFESGRGRYLVPNEA